MVFVCAILRGYEALIVWNVGEYLQSEAEIVVQKLNEIVEKNTIKIDDLIDKVEDDIHEHWSFTPLGCNTKLFLDIKDELTNIAPLACIPDYVDLSVVDLSLHYFISVATVDKNIRISYDLLILISKNEYLKIKID